MTQHHAAPEPLRVVLGKLAGLDLGPKQQGDNFVSRCPAHDDKNPSFVVSTGADGRVLLNCHANCTFDMVVAALGLKPADLFPAKPRASSTRARHRERNANLGREAAVYDYRDEVGALLFQVVRYENGTNKTFRQRRPDPTKPGEWIWNATGVRKVPYRLTQIREALGASRPIYVAEGEKAVHRLVAEGFDATCNAGGAKKWTASHAEHIKGARVIILPDNDAVGREHAEIVAGSLQGIAAEVRVVELPGLAAPGDDAVEWFDAGHTAAELVELAAAAMPWTASPETPAPKVDPEDFRQTDIGNAELMKAQHGDDLRFCDVWGKWLAWDGARFRHDDSGEVIRRAIKTVRTIEDRRHSDDSESAGSLRAMVFLASKMLFVRPDDVDRDPFALNVHNGTVDLRSGSLRPHRRDDLMTRLSPVAYDPAATCPLWERFLLEIMGGNEALCGFLQRAVGYSLTGDVGEQVLFFLHGDGSNGKSTFLSILLAMLGDYSVAAPAEILLEKKGDAHPTERTVLLGRRLVTCSEVEAGRFMAEAQVKQLTGGDPISARYMRQDFFTFPPTHKLFLAANHKPPVRGTDYAIWRRMRLIPFAVKIDKPDRTLASRIIATELSGILAWAVRGCMEWQRDGLKAPAEVIEATAEYRAEMDLVAPFLEECTVQIPTARVSRKALYNAYLQWCDDNGENAIAPRTFTQRVHAKGYQECKTRGTRGWSGLGLGARGADGGHMNSSYVPPEKESDFT